VSWWSREKWRRYTSFFSRNRPVLVRTRLISVFFGSSHAGFLKINKNDV
jgi:hypothetical protein